jgi:hypothetical protein
MKRRNAAGNQSNDQQNQNSFQINFFHRVQFNILLINQTSDFVMLIESLLGEFPYIIVEMSSLPSITYLCWTKFNTHYAPI